MTDDIAKLAGGHPGCYRWSQCPNAQTRYENGWPVMRCKVTNEHPDECHPVKRYRKENGYG